MKRLFYLIAILPLMLVGCENFGEENPTAPKLDDLFSEADLAKLDGFSAEGGQATLTFTPDLSWEASANRTWITVSPESGEAGEEIKLKVRLAENTSPNVRSGIVTVKLSDGSSFPIPVRQLGNENAELPNVVVDKSYHEIDSNGGELAVQISTNTEDYEVVIKESDKAWLSLTDTRAMQDKILVFTATKNESTQSREAKVTIYFGDEGSISFTIYQEGAQQQEEEPVLELVDGQNYEINPDGGDIDIKVLSNVAYAVEIPAEATWLHKAEPSRAATESIVTLYATKNDTGAKRSAEVKLTYADSTPVTFTVSQEPAEGGVTPPTPGATTIADVLAGELGNYTVEGAWVVATYDRGCLLTDASEAYILAFQPSETPEVGAVVNITGETTIYGDLKQFKQGATVSVTKDTHEVVHPTAEVMDGAALDEYLTAPTVKYVEYEGTLDVSTNSAGTTTYYNITINGAATAVGSVQYPTEDIKAQLAELDGKLVKVTGFLIGVSTGKYTNTMAVSVVESENVAPEIPVVSIADITKAGTYIVNNAWAVATYANGALLTDASGALILAFKPSEAIAVGEVVNIQGNVSAYAGLLQFGQGTVTKTGETKEVVHPTAEIMDGAALDAYLSAPVVKYVEYEGTLGVSTNSSGTTTYYNVTINGATAIGSVQYPTEEIKAQLATLDGKSIKVTGYLIGVSNKSSVPTYANTMAISVEEVASTPVVPPTNPTISEVLAGEDGAYTIDGAWVVATYERGCLLTDASGAYILAFQPSTTPVVGTVVNITGETTTYGGLKQFAKGATFTETGTTTVTHPTAEVMNGTALDAYLTAPAVKYVEYEGTLGISTNASGTTTYYNVTINGATAVGSVQYPTEEIKTQLSALDGKLVKVTGYLIGVSSSKYANTMAVSVVESENAAPEASVVNIADITAAGLYKVNNAWAVATYANGALLTDASGAYILAFQPSETPAVGEVVNIEGNVSAYGGLLQFGKGATVTKTDETKEITHPTAEVMNGAALDAYLSAPVVKYVEYEGTLGISTNSSGTTTYYNVTIDGATAIGSVQYPTEEIKTQLSALDGKSIKVSGYLIGVSSNKYTNTMAVSVAEVTEVAGSNPNDTENFTPGDEQNPGWN